MAKEVVPIHGPDHCPGGPDPIPCLGTSLAWINHPSGSSDVTPNVAYDLTAEGGAGGNPYDSGFISTPDAAGFQIDLDNGVITWSAEGEYLIEASLQVNSDFNGVDFSVLIDYGSAGVFGGGDRKGNLQHGTFMGGSEAMEANRWGTVDVRTYVDLGPNASARLLFVHNDATDATIESLYLKVVLLRYGLQGATSFS